MSTLLSEVTNRIVREVSTAQAAALELFSAQMLDMGASPETHEMVIIGPTLEQVGNEHHLVTRYYVRRRVP